jgi:CRISPR-associated endoribonuclease Cas6
MASAGSGGSMTNPTPVYRAPAQNSMAFVGPQAWWVPLATEYNPRSIRVEHLHAALTHWFDQPEPGGTLTPHQAVLKPYSLSPLTLEDGEWGVEVKVLTLPASQVIQGVAVGTQLQLGCGAAMVTRLPHLLYTESWKALVAPHRANRWLVDFLTPTTFRLQGGRSSPWPSPELVLGGLRRHWQEFSLEPLDFSPDDARSVWISNHNLNPSHVIELRVGAASGSRKGKLTLTGFTGVVEFSCAEPLMAPRINSLFRLAPYVGVGAQREKGLGVVRVESQFSGTKRAVS